MGILFVSYLQQFQKEMQKRRRSSITGIVTAVVFAVVQVGTPLPVLAIEKKTPPEVKVPTPFKLNLPPDLGTIQNLNTGTGPTLIHLQDAHGNYEAQKKIEAILNYLKEKYGIKLILLEGSAHRLNPELVRVFPNRVGLSKKVADRLAKDAYAKAVELFLIDSPEVETYGIENLESYVANGKAFIDVLTEREKTEGFISDMDMQIERLTGPYLNKDLRAFLKRLEDFEAKRLPILEWLNYLKSQAKTYLEIDLADPAYQIDWPTLIRIYKLGEFESKLDMKAFMKERNGFLSDIQGLSPQGTVPLEDLLTSPLSRHQLPDPETGILFEKMVASLPKDFNYDAYPNVKIFIGHLILQSEVKGERLMEEMNRVTEQISERLAKTGEEKKILALLKDHRLLKRLFALELSPEDYEAIVNPSLRGSVPNDGLKPSHIIQRFLELNGSHRVRNREFTHVDEIDSLFEKALEFYRGVKERDEWMLRNIEARLKETRADKAVIITGGFHAEPFQKFFSNKNYSYALIAPQITATDGREAYVQSVLETRLKPAGVVRSTRMAEPYLGVRASTLRSGYEVDDRKIVSRVGADSMLEALKNGVTIEQINEEIAGGRGYFGQFGGAETRREVYGGKPAYLLALEESGYKIYYDTTSIEEVTSKETRVPGRVLAVEDTQSGRTPPPLEFDLAPTEAVSVGGRQIIIDKIKGNEVEARVVDSRRAEVRMLVLSRKVSETIVIGGGEIKLTVVEIRGDRVRLGIEAPPEVPVHRQEVHDAIKTQEAKVKRAIETLLDPNEKKRSKNKASEILVSRLGWNALGPLEKALEKVKQEEPKNQKAQDLLQSLIDQIRRAEVRMSKEEGEKIFSQYPGLKSADPNLVKIALLFLEDEDLRAAASFAGFSQSLLLDIPAGRLRLLISVRNPKDYWQELEIRIERSGFPWDMAYDLSIYQKKSSHPVTYVPLGISAQTKNFSDLPILVKEILATLKAHKTWHEWFPSGVSNARAEVRKKKISERGAGVGIGLRKARPQRLRPTPTSVTTIRRLWRTFLSPHSVAAQRPINTTNPRHTTNKTLSAMGISPKKPVANAAPNPIDPRLLQRSAIYFLRGLSNIVPNIAQGSTSVTGKIVTRIPDPPRRSAEVRTEKGGRWKVEGGREEAFPSAVGLQPSASSRRAEVRATLNRPPLKEEDFPKRVSKRFKEAFRIWYEQLFVEEPVEKLPDFGQAMERAYQGTNPVLSMISYAGRVIKKEGFQDQKPRKDIAVMIEGTFERAAQTLLMQQVEAAGPKGQQIIQRVVQFPATVPEDRRLLEEAAEKLSPNWPDARSYKHVQELAKSPDAVVQILLKKYNESPSRAEVRKEVEGVSLGDLSQVQRVRDFFASEPETKQEEGYVVIWMRNPTPSPRGDFIATYLLEESVPVSRFLETAEAIQQYLLGIAKKAAGNQPLNLGQVEISVSRHMVIKNQYNVGLQFPTYIPRAEVRALKTAPSTKLQVPGEKIENLLPGAWHMAPGADSRAEVRAREAGSLTPEGGRGIKTSGGRLIILRGDGGSDPTRTGQESPMPLGSSRRWLSPQRPPSS